jgi:hypothetical protein
MSITEIHTVPTTSIPTRTIPTITIPTWTSDETADFGLVAFDLYRDIHKGIRSELFAVTAKAGSIDLADRCDRVALLDHVTSVAAVLESHAHHEDVVIEPALMEHAPALAATIAADHHALEARFAWIGTLSGDLAAAAGSDQRRLGHLLYLELSGFTSAYLAHQIVEERVVMPALERAIGVDAVLGMHVAIISSIPPDEMAQSLTFMLPAMNADDRAEMLGGIRATAPAEAFAGVVSLARSVLEPADFAATAARLGLG